MPPGLLVIPVEAAAEMERALRREARRADAVVMAAAVSDFKPVRVAAAKLPRRAGLTLRLRATPDLVARLPRRGRQVVAGFALETDRALARAARKLRAKRLDLVLAQQTNGHGGPFGRQPVRAWLLTKRGSPQRLGRVSKRAIARALLDKLEALWYGQRRSGG